MKIGGLQKLTLVDYPGKVAATVFLIGCNFQCGFCHNPELVDPNEIKKHSQISEKEFFDFLQQKEGLIEGICITGGEPTIHPDLIDFIRKIKNMGFLIKLDTNGSNPEILQKLIDARLVDFIAMDIKSSQENYEKTTRVKIDLNQIKKSIKIIKDSGIDYEFRTTVVPELVDEEDIKKIGQWLKGAKKISLQQFHKEKTLDKDFRNIEPYSEEELKKFAGILKDYAREIEIRL